jgi:hypothetical protein
MPHVRRHSRVRAHRAPHAGHRYPSPFEETCSGAREPGPARIVIVGEGARWRVSLIAHIAEAPLHGAPAGGKAHHAAPATSPDAVASAPGRLVVRLDPLTDDTPYRLIIIRADTLEDIPDEQLLRLAG